MTKPNQSVYLVGNPNCGKSTLFNHLTGRRQKIGNWPGVTVEQLSGHYKHNQQTFDVVDLPGLYELSVFDSSAMDHQIAFDAIYQKDMDWVVNIVDAAHLERHLYLTLQLLEMGVPVVLAVNMMDVAKRRGIQLDLDHLSQALGCPVVSMSCRFGRGVEDLKNQLHSSTPKDASFKMDYPQPIAKAITKLSQHLVKGGVSKSSANFMAIRLLEGDASINHPAVEAYSLAQVRQDLEKELNESLDIVFADSRYQWIGNMIDKVQETKATYRQQFSAAVDKVVLNRFLGVPIFLVMMYLMFEFSITLGTALQPFFDQGSTVIFIQGVSHLASWIGLPLWLNAMLAHGIGLGINTVLTFAPQIGCLFIFLSILEDSGYMSRAALVMDRVMQKIGLPGKAFVPLIIGFGCNVPAVLATRTLDSNKDRLLTIMMSPFMACGARLAIFAVFAGAFFPRNGAFVVFLLYLIGIAAAIVTGLIMNRFVIKGQHEPYLMELPTYHLPNLKTVFLQAWRRLRRFVVRAGRWIIPICLLVGSLNAITVSLQVVPGGSSDSLLAKVGQNVTPVLHPMGIQNQNWPATVGLLTGVLAKEVVVGTLNTLYSQNKWGPMDEGQNHFHLWAGLQDAVAQTWQSLKAIGWEQLVNPLTANEADHHMDKTAMGRMVYAFSTPLAAFCYLLFVLLYVPCVSTIAVTAKEAGKTWAYISALWSTSMAYVLAVMCYQVFQLTTTPLQSLAWILGGMLYLVAFIGFLSQYWQKSQQKQLSVRGQLAKGVRC